MAKSFASALVGIAIDEGHIKSVDEPITNYIFELREKDKRFGSITIRNLLTMSLGRTLRAKDYGDSGLVFATSKSTPHDVQNIVNRYFKPLLKRAELPYIRWHDLRHTDATLLLARGTHPTYVQKSLGHASVQLTLDRYSHWMPSMGRNTAEGIDEALG